MRHTWSSYEFSFWFTLQTVNTLKGFWQWLTAADIRHALSIIITSPWKWNPTACYISINLKSKPWRDSTVEPSVKPRFWKTHRLHSASYTVTSSLWRCQSVWSGFSHCHGTNQQFRSLLPCTQQTLIWQGTQITVAGIWHELSANINIHC